MARSGSDPAPVSFAILALAVASTGVVFLALTTLAVALLPLEPVGRAVVALSGVVLTIVAMGVTSNRMTDRALRAEYGDDPGGPADGRRNGPAGSAEGEDEGRLTDGLG